MYYIASCKKDRNVELDILKAIGIILVVMGHSGSPIKRFIYLFHMAIFFIASGYFYRDKNAKSVKAVFASTWKRIKGLWIPFFIGNMIFTLLNNFFIDINIYTDNPRINIYLKGPFIGTTDRLSIHEMLARIIRGGWFTSWSQLCGTYWFLRVLFYISILYLAIDFFVQKICYRKRFLIQGVVSCLFLTIGFGLSIKDFHFHDIEIALSLYCLYYIGNVLGTTKKSERLTFRNWNIVLVIAFTILITLNFLHIDIETGANSYVNPIILLVASLSGWFFLYAISYDIVSLSKKRNLDILKRALCLIGNHTLAIMTLHFLAFKIVNLLIVRIYGFPDFCIAAFPVIPAEAYNKGIDFWWIVYVFVGVTMPLAVGIIWQYIKQFAKKIIVYDLHME